MKFIPQSIPEVVLIEPTVHGDERGYFTETYRQDLFVQNVVNTTFVQDNQSKSKRGTLRGLHYQLAPHAQSKLVRVVEGEVLDVAVDIRQGSPSFGRHVAVRLSAANQRQLFVPRGFAHGFLVLSETATFCYKVDNYYSRECDRGIAFDDPALGIDWGMDAAELLLSDKDKNALRLDLAETFDFNLPLY